MLINCDTCAGQGVHCHDCVISVLLTTPSQTGSRAHVDNPRIELDSEEQIAFVSLAEAGLVPPLRLVADHEARAPSGRRAAG